ncbi:MAG: site-2 protease family protein [Planctomycetes bacterium]|nr:site-2 protease family protein [Planctomycetota bacterium]
MLAVANFTPLFGAVLICWIFSVCIHEFAHALVAYWGGDESVKAKGYLRFDIFSYIHPVTSILIPVLFLAMGGLPLPGGAVYIDRSLLRNKHWGAAVSLAGPLSNFLLFLSLAFLVHPHTGLVDPMNEEPPKWAILLGAMCVLELWSVLFNLIPIPPLDGFGIIEPYLSYENRLKAHRLGWTGLFIIYFVMSSKQGMSIFMNITDATIHSLGLPYETTWRFYNYALFGSST